MTKKIPRKSIEETLDMLKGDWVMEPLSKTDQVLEKLKKKYPNVKNMPKSAVFINPDITKEENERRIENLLDVMASIVVITLIMISILKMMRMKKIKVIYLI